MDSITNNLIANIKNKSSDLATGENKQERANKLREACAGFEGMFFSMMMKGMRQASEAFEGGVVEKGKGEKIFTEMLDQEYITAMGKNSSTGIGETLYKHLIMSVSEFKDLQDIEKINDKSGVKPYNKPSKADDIDSESMNIMNKLNELKSMRDSIPQESFKFDKMF